MQFAASEDGGRPRRKTNSTELRIVCLGSGMMISTARLTICSTFSSSRICSSASDISQFRNWFSSLIRSNSFCKLSWSFDSFSSCNASGKCISRQFVDPAAELTACHTSDEVECVPGCGLSDGGADESAESLSDPDKSCARERVH